MAAGRELRRHAADPAGRRRYCDLPRSAAITCLTGILQRRWRYRSGQHAKDGLDDRITWNFIRYIWGYRKTMRPKVHHLLDEHGDNAQLITLTTRRQAARFTAQRRVTTSTQT